MCKHCKAALAHTKGPRQTPDAQMPMAARANGLWHGPDPPQLSSLSYAETKVINLARVYVSVRRIFLDRSSYAATTSSEAPLYHQRNVVAYPQNPDAAITALGISPKCLAKTLTVQFIGSDRQALRREPDLCVSVAKLREAFAWLSSNSWPFMEATKEHPFGESDVLDDALESLLQAYTESTGGTAGGVPEELVQSASRIATQHSTVHASGPANCTADGDADPDDTKSLEDAFGDAGCAAAIDGGVDDLSPLQLWDIIMKKYKVAQTCDDELARLKDTPEASAREDILRRRAHAIASAVDGLAKLHHHDSQAKLREFVRTNASTNSSSVLKIPHSSDYLSNKDSLFWFSCFVRLFPRGDCAERCSERLTVLPSWRWAKTLLTRADFHLWQTDVELVATMYNVFLRRDQVNAVEASVRSTRFSQTQLADLQGITATGLVASALSSGDVNSVREMLKKKNLDVPVQAAFRSMQIIQRNVRGSEAERDNLIPKFLALRVWSGCSSLFFTLNPHDIKSPITLSLLDGCDKLEKRFSLDFTDA